jgi:hypothetical protein
LEEVVDGGGGEEGDGEGWGVGVVVVEMGRELCRCGDRLRGGVESSWVENARWSHCM